MLSDRPSWRASFRSTAVVGGLCWLPLLLADAAAPFGIHHFSVSPVLRSLLGISALVAISAAISVVLGVVAGLTMSGVVFSDDRSRFAGLAPETTMVVSAVTLLVAPLLHPAGVVGVSASLVLLCVTILSVALSTTLLIGVVALMVPPTAAWPFPRVRLLVVTAAWAGSAGWALQLKQAPVVVAVLVAAVSLALLGALADGGNVTRRMRAIVVGLCGVVLPLATVFLAAESPTKTVQPERAARSQTKPPNVVVLMIDTLRADWTSLGSANPEATPYLAELAGARATYFEHAIAPASATIPSVKGLFTGMAPSAWGMERSNDPPPDTALLLGQVFARAGYRAGAFSANPLIDYDGFGRGFGAFWSANGYRYANRSTMLNSLLGGDSVDRVLRQIEELGLHKLEDETVLMLAREWLGQQREAQPYFLYVHLFGPHWPYNDRGYFDDPQLTGLEDFSYVEFMGVSPGHSSNARFRASPEVKLLEHCYREEIRAADDLVGKFVMHLSERRDDTVVIIVGDHGEEFFEHNGFGHGHDVFEELVHVPLLVLWPDSSQWDGMPMRVETPVSLLDVMPTLVELAAIAVPDGLHGRSLLPLMRAPSTAQPLAAVVSQAYTPVRAYTAYRTGTTKVRLRSDDEWSPWDTPFVLVFDLDAEPGEIVPLARDSEPAMRAASEARDWFAANWNR